MVNKAAVLVALIAVCIVAASTFSLASAAGSYTVNQEWAQIFIQQDGTIDLTYNVSITVTSGTIHAFDLGQPNQDFTIGQAYDQYGNQLNAYKYNPDVASVDFKQPLTAGQSIWWTITTNVGGMIFNDTTNPGNYGMQFIPQWDTNYAVNNVRIQIVLPEGVQVGDVKTTQNYYNGTSTVDGKLAVYWENPGIGANEQFRVGVSFPSKYMPNYVPQATTSPGEGGVDFLPIIIAVVFALIAVSVLIYIIYRASKRSYQKPQVSMETLGVKRGLTAVEASYILDMKPPQLVTEILYSLLQKRAVWAEENKPALKLKILPPYENKTGSTENPLRYYEIDFLNSIKADGTLDEEKLAKNSHVPTRHRRREAEGLQPQRHRGLLPQNRRTSMETGRASRHPRLSLKRLQRATALAHDGPQPAHQNRNHLPRQTLPAAALMVLVVVRLHNLPPAPNLSPLTSATPHNQAPHPQSPAQTSQTTSPHRLSKPATTS